MSYWTGDWAGDTYLGDLSSRNLILKYHIQYLLGRIMGNHFIVSALLLFDCSLRKDYRSCTGHTHGTCRRRVVSCAMGGSSDFHVWIVRSAVVASHVYHPSDFRFDPPRLPACSLVVLSYNEPSSSDTPPPSRNSSGSTTSLPNEPSPSPLTSWLGVTYAPEKIDPNIEYASLPVTPNPVLI